MEKYLIVLDLDGTLLNSNQKITSDTLKCLKNLKKIGHKIILASGRPLKSILEYYELLELDTPIIAYNGGAIYGMNTNFKTYEQTYDLEDVLYCYNKLGKENLLNVMCETSTHVYLLKDDKTFDKWFLREGLTIVEGDLNNTLKEDPLSMIFYLEDKNMSLLMKQTKHLKNDAKMRMWSGGKFAEVYYPKYNKLHAVENIASYYNIDKNHIIAFGDAGNDIELIKELKYGIAMKNSAEELLLIAKNVTKFDNDNDGIAHYLNEFFNKIVNI